MYNIKNYIVDGRVRREKIAMDIKYRSLKKEDILALIENPVIKEAFIGKRYDKKKPQNDWNKDYLDTLSYAVISESFNRDYLLYLNDVAEYVNRKEKNSKMIIAFVVLLVAIAALVVVWMK